MDDIAELKRRVDRGVPKARVARDFEISRETLYAYLRDVDGTKRKAALAAQIAQTKRLRKKAPRKRASRGLKD